MSPLIISRGSFEYRFYQIFLLLQLENLANPSSKKEHELAKLSNSYAL